MKRLERKVEGCAEEGEEGSKRKRALEERWREARVDVMYAVYFPLNVDYVPLWPEEHDLPRTSNPSVYELRCTLACSSAVYEGSSPGI